MELLNDIYKGVGSVAIAGTVGSALAGRNVLDELNKIEGWNWAWIVIAVAIATYHFHNERTRGGKR